MFKKKHSSLKGKIVAFVSFLPVLEKTNNLLHSNCTADQCLCFRCTDSTILLLLKSKILNF